MTAPVAKFLLRAVLMIQAQVLALTIHLLTQTGTSDSELGFQKGVPKGFHKGPLTGGGKKSKNQRAKREVSRKLPGSFLETSRLMVNVFFDLFIFLPPF